MGEAARIETAIGRFQHLRGFLALWIVLGHCSVTMSGPVFFLKLMQKCDLLCVGCFFFLSAYGLYRSFETKENYRRGFLSGHPLRLLLRAMMAGVAAEVIQRLIWTSTLKGSYAEQLLEFLGRINWYVWEQIFFYLLFFILICLIRKKEWHLPVLTILTLVMILFLCRKGLNDAVVYSSLAFPLGAAFRLYGKQIETFAGKRKALCVFLGLCILMLTLLLLWKSGAHSLAGIFGRNLMVLLCCGFLTLLLTGIPFGWKWTTFLSKLSAGIYFYHFTAINTLILVFEPRELSKGMDFLAGVLLLTFLFALLEYGILVLGKRLQTRCFQGLEKKLKKTEKKD